MAKILTNIELALAKLELGNLTEALSNKSHTILKIVKALVGLSRKQLLVFAEKGGILSEAYTKYTLLCEADESTTIATVKNGNNHRVIQINGMKPTGEPMVLYTVAPMRDQNGQPISDDQLIKIIQSELSKFKSMKDINNTSAIQKIVSMFFRTAEAAGKELTRRDGSQANPQNEVPPMQATANFKDNLAAKQSSPQAHAVSKLKVIAQENLARIGQALGASPEIIQALNNDSDPIGVLQRIDDNMLYKAYLSFVWSDEHLLGKAASAGSYTGSIVEFSSLVAIPFLQMNDLSDAVMVNKQLAKLAISYIIFKILIVEAKKLEISSEVSKEQQKSQQAKHKIDTKNRELAMKEKSTRLKDILTISKISKELEGTNG